jgi:hypothetical protein
MAAVVIAEVATVIGEGLDGRWQVAGGTYCNCHPLGVQCGQAGVIYVSWLSERGVKGGAGSNATPPKGNRECICSNMNLLFDSHGFVLLCIASLCYIELTVFFSRPLCGMMYAVF